MDFTEKKQQQLDTALAMAHFAAAAAATVAAALHRGKPIGDSEIKHLFSALSTAAATAPEVSKPYFDTLANTLAGKHYEGG